MSASVPGVLSIDWDALRALGERAEQGHLQDGDLALVSRLVRTVVELAAVLSRRDATLARLRRFLFGQTSDRRQRAANLSAEGGAGNGSAPASTDSDETARDVSVRGGVSQGGHEAVPG